MNEETKKVSRKTRTPYRVYLMGVIGLSVLAGAGYYGWMKYNEKYNSQAAQEQAAADADDAEKKDVLEKLAKLMVLPEGDPVLFKVSDQEQMRKQQAFFKDAINDDILFVFEQSSKAIIYRPSANLVVNVGPVNFDQKKNAAKISAPAIKTSTTTQK